MAAHYTFAQMFAILGTTVANLTPYQVRAILSFIERIPHVEQPDSQAGAGEPTIFNILSSTNFMNP